MKMRFWIILSLICVMTRVSGESSVWKVSKGDRYLFLGGTVHVLSETDYPLPLEFEDAYRLADTLVFETDIQNASSPESQAALLAALTYQDGRTLEQVISKKTRKQLAAYLKPFGLEFDALKTFKPGMISSVITILELQRLGIASAGVDSYFCQKAVDDGKRLGQLETLEEQFGFLARMGEGMEDELISSSLREVEQTGPMLNGIIQAWRTGDTGALEESLNRDIREEDPQIYRELIVLRNEAWFPQITDMIQSDPVELILVGAAHMVGADGLLKMLTDEGYEVEFYHPVSD